MVGAEALSRWRVPLGWAAGLTALYVSSPRAPLYAAGLAIAAFGEAVRIWAAGHLDKNTRLTMSGPYAWTRNPLYFGSAWIGLGFALATGRLFLVAAVVALFVAVYVPVMKREAARLAEAFPAAYRAYADRTPLFWPRPRKVWPHPRKVWPHPPKAGDKEDGFSTKRLLANREHLTVAGWLAVAGIIGWKLWKLM